MWIDAVSYAETPWTSASFFLKVVNIFCENPKELCSGGCRWDKTLNAALTVHLDLTCYCQQSNKLKHSFAVLIFFQGTLFLRNKKLNLGPAVKKQVCTCSQHVLIVKVNLYILVWNVVREVYIWFFSVW